MLISNNTNWHKHKIFIILSPFDNYVKDFSDIPERAARSFGMLHKYAHPFVYLPIVHILV